MKKLLIALIVLILLGAAGAGGVYYALKSGFGGADDWVVRRVVKIAETYIHPKIDFDGFEWDGSKTITLTGVTLTADDGTEVVKADRMVIVTERVPVNGGAFIIEALTLEDATLRLVQTTGDDGGIAFKGLVPFARERNIANQEQIDESVKLSETFQIRTIDIVNGGFEYDAGDGSNPMTLAGITLDVDLTPEDSGNYELDVDLKREAVFEMALKGDLNIDALTLTGTDIKFDADLSSDEAMSALPPQVQSLLREYEVNGQLEVGLTGDLNGNDPAASDLQVQLSLSDGNFAFGEYRFPVSGANLRANIASKRLNVTKADISVVGGLMSLNRMTADLSADGIPVDVAWEARGIDIQQFLRARATEGEPPKFAGILATEGDAQFHVGDLAEAFDGTLDPSNITGNGTLTLRNGRLVSIPVVTDLVDAMDIVARLTGTQTNKDKADIEFALDGRGLDIPKKGLSLVTQVMSVNGRGRINFDQSLDLLVNGGPLEKLQDQLGGIGDIVGAITDGALKYDIEGTVSKPDIKIRPLGIGG